MPEQTEEKKEETTPAVEELQKSLQEVKSQNDKYQQLLKDPTMQLVLSKMAAGEEVILAEKAEETKPVNSMKEKLGLKEKPGELNLDELSNTDMTKVLSESVESYVDGVREESAKEHQKEWQLLKDELGKTQDALLTIVSQQQVKDVASQHKDFETYRPAMQVLSQEYPQLKMEDLYKLAKADHVLKSPNRQNTETEKPESSSPFPEWQPAHLRHAKTSETTKSVGPSTTALRTGGRKDFLSLVSEAAGSLVNKSNLGGS
jgi:hypothetical protein